MPKTLLAETLIECAELQHLYDLLPPCTDTTKIEKRIADCKSIIDYLRQRYIDLNRDDAIAEPTGELNPDEATSSIDVQQVRVEVAAMENAALLRYGTVLKYICTVEAEIMDMPLEFARMRLREARAEWLRRCGGSVIGDSI